MADAQRNTALYDKNSLKSDETLEKFVFSSLGTSFTPWIPRHTNLLLSHQLCFWPTVSAPLSPHL